jgi:uncharacterized protein (TIGR02118 family)
MATLMVLYPNSDGAKFDSEYYSASHIPLVQQVWGGLGMTGTEVLFPAPGKQPFVAMVLIRFRDQEAINAALASRDTAKIMGDVPKFTNIKPTMFRAND